MSPSSRKCSLKIISLGTGVHPQHERAPVGRTQGLVHSGRTSPAATDPEAYIVGINHVIHML